MEEEKSKEVNILSEGQENMIKEEIKFIQEEFKNKIEEYKRLKDELKNVKKSFNNGLKDYMEQKNFTVEKEKEIESLLSKISKMRKMMTLSMNQTISKKFFKHLLEISNNKQKEKILLKYFYFLFNIYNYYKIYLDNNIILDAKDTFYKINKVNKYSENYFTSIDNINNFIDNNQPIQDLLKIIRNETEIKNILAYSYDIFHNLQKEYKEIYLIVKKAYFELYNEINNIEKQYPFDFLFEFMKNNFEIIDYENQVEDLKNILNKLIQEKNSKFVEVKNIESIIKTYNRNSKIISNYIKALKSFYYRLKEQNNININGNNKINNNDIMKELIEDIEKFKKISINYDKINTNFDVLTSLSFGTNYTLSEKSSIKSSNIDSKNNIINNENEKNINKKSINKNHSNNININLELEKQNKSINSNNIKIIKNFKNNNDENYKSEKIINKTNKIKKNININKDNKIKNNSFIGKRNNKTIKNQNIFLSNQKMIINFLTANDNKINKKFQIKKQLNTKLFINKINLNQKKNISFNKESNNKNFKKVILSKPKQNEDQKILKNKLSSKKLFNKKIKEKKNINNNNNSYNFININKNNNINNLCQNLISRKINKDNSKIFETKRINNNVYTDKTKTLKIENKHKIKINEKEDNNILSIFEHTNNLKLNNTSEKNTEKEFDNKSFLINSNKKNDFIGNNSYNISKKIKQLKQKDQEEAIEITMPNKRNNINDDYFDSNSIKDSICDEMISQNFGTANNLIRSTTNDYINRLGFKNNVLWSENLYKNKVMKFKSNFKKLNLEKPIDTSTCCAACT